MNGGSNARKYLLTGLLHCGLCGARLVARPATGRRPCYVCASPPDFTGCGKIRITAPPLHEWVTDLVLFRLDSCGLADALAAERRETDDGELVRRLAGDEAALEQLARDHYVERLISRGEFVAARQGLDARVAATSRLLLDRQQRRQLSGLVGSGAALRDQWAEITLERRRAILAAVVTKVTVNPAIVGRNFFYPERVEVTWA